MESIHQRPVHFRLPHQFFDELDLRVSGGYHDACKPALRLGGADQKSGSAGGMVSKRANSLMDFNLGFPK
jgi:hypothetical protein